MGLGFAGLVLVCVGVMEGFLVLSVSVLHNNRYSRCETHKRMHASKRAHTPAEPIQFPVIYEERPSKRQG